MTRGVPAALGGSVSAATGSVWACLSGPGEVTFSDATVPGTSAIFSQPGSYLLRLTASNSRAEVSRTFSVNVLSHLETWRFISFGSTANAGSASDLTDGNGDGEMNLMEFATAQNPNAATRAIPTLVRMGSMLDFTYTRGLAAMSDGMTFTVEWSDTLAVRSWSSTGVTEQILTDNGTVQTVKATIPTAGTISSRYLHLKVTQNAP